MAIHMAQPGRSSSSGVKVSCAQCGPHHCPRGYARALDLKVSTPKYHELSRGLLLDLYQHDQMALFQRLMDPDRVADWARTTPRTAIGIGQRKEAHPFKRYLEDVYPDLEGWHARWRIFPSACEALKGFPHLPHHRNISFFTNVVVESTWVTFTMFVPLPSWTQRLIAQLQALPFDSKITREYFLTLLRCTSHRGERR